MSDETGTGDAGVSAGESTAKSRRYFRAENAQAKLENVAVKRGRRKAKPRYDAEDVPVDGDTNALLALTNRDPAYEYFWVSDDDAARFRGRPWVKELWGPGCCRPDIYFGEPKSGETIRFQELTLMKCGRSMRNWCAIATLPGGITPRAWAPS